MSTRRRPGSEPAFPRTGYHPDTGGDWEAVKERLPAATTPQDGLSVRDWAAAKMMAAAVAALLDDGGDVTDSRAAACARLAYRLADALIAEGDRPPLPPPPRPFDPDEEEGE